MGYVAEHCRNLPAEIPSERCEEKNGSLGLPCSEGPGKEALVALTPLKARGKEEEGSL